MGHPASYHRLLLMYQPESRQQKYRRKFTRLFARLAPRKLDYQARRSEVALILPKSLLSTNPQFCTLPGTEMPFKEQQTRPAIGVVTEVHGPVVVVAAPLPEREFRNVHGRSIPLV